MNIEPLCNLGEWLSRWLAEYESKEFKSNESKMFADLILKQHLLNSWHREQDIIVMLDHLSNQLNAETLFTWTERYPELLRKQFSQGPVMVKANHNHPFAAIQEWLACIITNTPLVLSANENQYQILKFLSNKIAEQQKELLALFHIQPKNVITCNKYIIYTEKTHNPIHEYFKDRKALLIEPTNSIGIITGKETVNDFTNLGKDIFYYLGQSPRSLRKIYIPVNFDIKGIISALEPYSGIYQNNKYANNYDYHQSVFLMNRISFLDNGFLIFKEDYSNDAPTGCLFYEYYDSLPDVLKRLKDSDQIENIICTENLPVATVKPGESHFFQLDQYLNNRDLVDFFIG